MHGNRNAISHTVNKKSRADENSAPPIRITTLPLHARSTQKNGKFRDKSRLSLVFLGRRLVTAFPLRVAGGALRRACRHDASHDPRGSVQPNADVAFPTGLPRLVGKCRELEGEKRFQRRVSRARLFHGVPGSILVASGVMGWHA